MKISWVISATFVALHLINDKLSGNGIKSRSINERKENLGRILASPHDGISKNHWKKGSGSVSSSRNIDWCLATLGAKRFEYSRRRRTEAEVNPVRNGDRRHHLSVL